MPEPKKRSTSKSTTSRAGNARDYESQAQNLLNGTRLAPQAKKPGPAAGAPASKKLDTTLVEKLIAFLQDMD